MASEVRFRAEQRAIIDGYKGGKLGIAAVPGSGKTFTLSHLAARLVERLTERGLIDRQEVLVVTFTNTAVNNFRSRIAEILNRERGLLPYVGYRVRTLHALAHDIVRERPALVGLAEDFQIIDERVAEGIIHDVAQSLLPGYLEIFSGYLNLASIGSDKQRQRIGQHDLPELAVRIAQQFVKHAKNRLLDPVSLRAALVDRADLPLAHFGLAVYEDYQRSLNYRGAVDFDDLVRLAIYALETEEDYCARLRDRWCYILEDEAQDSSWLQERMLRLLSGEKNWVRVGDPNQAINTTFTTADPRFLRDFLQESGVKGAPLQISGRSAKPIIDLANRLVQWSIHEHIVPALRDAFYEQEIRPTRRGDPQPNPPADDTKVYIHYQPGDNVSPESELEVVAASLERYLAEHKDRTVAALIPDNKRAYELVEILKARNIPYEDELLRSTTATRQAVATLRAVLNYLGNPLSPAMLAQLYRLVWWSSRFCTLEREDTALLESVGRVLSGCKLIESFLWPTTGRDWLDSLPALADQLDVLADLSAFRSKVQTWLRATTLPIDQLVLTLTQDLFIDPSDIALGHKVAVLLRSMAQGHTDWRLPEFAEELRTISENERKFIGFDDAEHGYSPKPGCVTISTMHGAKGLEWDRVYLLAVNNYDFPSAEPYDEYRSERWFIRDNLNLEAEVLAQLDVIRNSGSYAEGEASAQARLDYAAERLRLLYVGITRARRDLIVTWNTGRYWKRGGNAIKRPALPLVVLWEHLQGKS